VIETENAHKLWPQRGKGGTPDKEEVKKKQVRNPAKRREPSIETRVASKERGWFSLKTAHGFFHGGKGRDWNQSLEFTNGKRRPVRFLDRRGGGNISEEISNEGTKIYRPEGGDSRTIKHG